MNNVNELELTDRGTDIDPLQRWSGHIRRCDYHRGPEKHTIGTVDQSLDKGLSKILVLGCAASEHELVELLKTRLEHLLTMVKDVQDNGFKNKIVILK